MHPLSRVSLLLQLRSNKPKRKKTLLLLKNLKPMANPVLRKTLLRMILHLKQTLLRSRLNVVAMAEKTEKMESTVRAQLVLHLTDLQNMNPTESLVKKLMAAFGRVVVVPEAWVLSPQTLKTPLREKIFLRAPSTRLKELRVRTELPPRKAAAAASVTAPLPQSRSLKSPPR